MSFQLLGWVMEGLASNYESGLSNEGGGELRRGFDEGGDMRKCFLQDNLFNYRVKNGWRRSGKRNETTQEVTASKLSRVGDDSHK